jgi:MYXO-CTERM domain-containing protein
MLSTLEDTPLVLAGSMAPIVDDPDADGEVEELRITCTGSVISLAQLGGLVFLDGDGVLDPTVQVRGTIADLNLALNGAIVTPARDYNGTAEVLFTVDDLGHTGAGGPLSTTAPLEVVVLPVDDPPTAVDDELSLLITAGTTPIAVLANDSSGDANQTPHLVSVPPAEHGFAIVDGDVVDYTPNASFVGDDHFQYTMTDGVTQASAHVTVHMAAPAPPSEVHLGGGFGCTLGGAAGEPGAALLLFGLLALMRRRRR